MKSSALLALLLLALSASTVSSTGAAPPEPADEAALLMQLDRDFDAASAKDGAEAWVAFFGDHGAILPAAAAPVSGPDAIREAMSPVFQPGTSSASVRTLVPASAFAPSFTQVRFIGWPWNSIRPPQQTTAGHESLSMPSM